ncbi:MAG: hypothetical protein MK086_13810 [Flavobacteriales bacterium]|nr:hypothetical protein [Flavobacteriales bacterium]
MRSKPSPLLMNGAAWLQAPAQNPFWTFPEQGFDGDGMFTLPTDDYTGQEADYVHAGLKDPYDEIMFFMMDGELYYGTGEETAEFDDGPRFLMANGPV